MTGFYPKISAFGPLRSHDSASKLIHLDKRSRQNLFLTAKFAKSSDNPNFGASLTRKNANSNRVLSIVRSLCCNHRILRAFKVQ